MIDYDLVVLGSNPVARWAAATAASWRARVAQVPVCDAPTDRDWLLALGAITHQLHTTQELAPLWPTAAPPTLHWDQLGRWLERVATTQVERPTIAQLSSQGIDWVPGEAQFVQKPKLALQVGDRKLRSRRYLLCFDPPVPPTPRLPLATDIPILTLADLVTQLQTHPCPAALGILGRGPLALQTSQRLARLGVQVTVLLSGNEPGDIATELKPSPVAQRSLPTEEAEAVFWVQAQLEAEGIQFLSQGQITNITPLPSHRYQVQTPTHTFIADALLDVRETLPLTSLPQPLEAFNLATTPQGLWVNPKLQTSHPQIYASGACLGGYHSPELSRYEASLALHNALLLPPRSVNYHHQPWVLWTDPALARVGFTAAQAQARDPKSRVLRWSTATQPQHPIRTIPLQFCQLIVGSQGQLVGAHLVGRGAAELIPLLAFACQQQCQLPDLADLMPWLIPLNQGLESGFSPSPHIPLSWLERFFNLCRDWHLQ